MYQARALLLFSALVALQSGCAGTQDFLYRRAKRDLASDAWKVCGDQNASALYYKDYRKGWKQGYYDVATGSCGVIPPVPPQKYWSAKYQTAPLCNAVSVWYRGYEFGAIAAESCAEGYRHNVPSYGGALANNPHHPHNAYVIGAPDYLQGDGVTRVMHEAADAPADLDGQPEPAPRPPVDGLAPPPGVEGVPAPGATDAPLSVPDSINDLPGVGPINDSADREPASNPFDQGIRLASGIFQRAINK